MVSSRCSRFPVLAFRSLSVSSPSELSPYQYLFDSICANLWAGFFTRELQFGLWKILLYLLNQEFASTPLHRSFSIDHANI